MRRRRRGLAVVAFVAAALGCTSREPPAPPASDGALFPIRVDGKWGYMDRAAHVVIPPQWDDAERFAEDLAAVGNRSVEVNGGVSQGRSHQGWIDRTGRVVIPLEWDDAGDFTGGLARVKRDDRYGFVDPTGRIVVPPQYEDAAPFAEGLAAVKRNGKTGFIDATGAVVIPFAYDRAAWIASFHDGRGCAFTVDASGAERAGYVDPRGRLVIPPRYEWAQPFSEGLAIVRTTLDAPPSFIDRDGNTVIQTTGRDGLSFYEGLAPIETDAGWTFIDRTGATVIPALPYRHVGVFIEGRAGVARGSAWGFIDTRGREVIPTTWTGISTFKDGLAQMESGSLFGGLEIAWIDREGRVVWRER